MKFQQPGLPDEEKSPNRARMRKGYEVQLIDDNNVTKFVVDFVAPSDSFYSGYKWKVQVELPDGYPQEPPIVFFKDKIYHPNIDEASGFPCVDILDDTWTSSFELHHIFSFVIPQLLLNPNPDDPYNVDAGALYEQDTVLFAERVRDHCEKNATPV